MDTTATHPQPKRRGPAPKLGRMVDTHLHFPPDLLEWAKNQPEGFAALCRFLVEQERQRREGEAAAPGQHFIRGELIAGQ